MDTPQLTPELLAPALGPGGWTGCDAWFGPADDGGFWALGFAEPRPGLIRGIPMSTPHTGAAQRAALTGAGLTVRDLRPLRDVDTADDVRTVAAAVPHSRFAAAVAGIEAPDPAGVPAVPGPPAGPGARAASTHRTGART